MQGAQCWERVSHFLSRRSPRQLRATSRAALTVVEGSTMRNVHSGCVTWALVSCNTLLSRIELACIRPLVLAIAKFHQRQGKDQPSTGTHPKVHETVHKDDQADSTCCSHDTSASCMSPAPLHAPRPAESATAHRVVCHCQYHANHLN
jgi:hypothetical protein